MQFDLILNELSLRNLAANEEVAAKWMSELISTIKAFTAQGVKVNIRSKDDFRSIFLAPDYPISRWLNYAEEKERRFIKALVTKTPLSIDLENLEIQDIENNTGSSEYSYQEMVAFGLAVAYLLDTVAISFKSEEYWNVNSLEIQYLEYSEEGEEINQNLKVRHASLNTHVQYHAEWIQEKIQADIADGTDIWDRREELFPHLEFCENVGKQIQALYYGTPMLKQVEKKLFELENYCKNWIDGAFNSDLLASRATPESESRLDSLKEELSFECPDGEKRIFSWHLRMTGQGAWRLHFFPKGICPELKKGKIIIGYIGIKIQ